MPNIVPLLTRNERFFKAKFSLNVIFMIIECTAVQLLISQAIMAWRYVGVPTIRLGPAG
jgi:hypothetical protein